MIITQEWFPGHSEKCDIYSPLCSGLVSFDSRGKTFLSLYYLAGDLRFCTSWCWQAATVTCPSFGDRLLTYGGFILTYLYPAGYWVYNEVVQRASEMFIILSGFFTNGWLTNIQTHSNFDHFMFMRFSQWCFIISRGWMQCHLLSPQSHGHGSGLVLIGVLNLFRQLWKLPMIAVLKMKGVSQCNSSIGRISW